MASANGFPRVAFYSHDTFGLGHLTRSTRLARAIVEAFPRASVLLLSGSPVAHRFAFPPRVDYVKLPAVVKADRDTYVARELNMSNRGIRRMRAQLILAAVGHFHPDLLLVDNVPLGMRGELLPTLEMLRRDRPAAQIHLNLRDILDDPATIRSVWESESVHGALRRLYDAIHVFGSRDVFDAVTAYDLPKEKSAFLGYITPFPDELARAPEMPPADARRARILVTAGGGGDGSEILLAATCLQRALAKASPYHFDLVAGPLMDPPARDAVERDLHALDEITHHEFVEGLPAWMSRSDLVLSMGGYNTLCEVLALARRSVIVPRVHPRREQELRARALEARGLVRVLHPNELGPAALDRVLRAALAEAPSLPGSAPPLTGIPAFQERLGALLRGSCPRVAEPARPARGEKGADPGCGTGSLVSTPAGLRSRMAPVLRGRRPSRPAGGAFLTALAVALSLGAAAGGAAADLRPESVTAACGVGYDSNLLDASDAERLAFEQEDPGTLFAVNRMQDYFLELGLEAEWPMGRPLGWKTKLDARYERAQFLHNPIKSQDELRLRLQARSRAGTRVALGATHRPQVYTRHRADRDALPGMPVFRAETHRRWGVELRAEQPVGARTSLMATLEAGWRDYCRTFGERDRHTLGFSAGASWRARSRIEGGADLGYHRAWSRNRPDSETDYAYREWELGPWLRLRSDAGLADVTLRGVWAWRRYLSPDPEDWDHHGRRDRMLGFELVAGRAVTEQMRLDVSYAARQRTAQLPTGVALEFDEEGAFSEGVVRTALTWQWEPRGG